MKQVRCSAEAQANCSHTKSKAQVKSITALPMVSKQQRKRAVHCTMHNKWCVLFCRLVHNANIVQTVQESRPPADIHRLQVSQQHWKLTSDRTRVCSTAPAMLQSSMEGPSALNKKCPCSTGARLCRRVKAKAICGGAEVRSYSSAAVLLCSSKCVSDSPKPVCTPSGTLRHGVRLGSSAAVLQVKQQVCL